MRIWDIIWELDIHNYFVLKYEEGTTKLRFLSILNIDASKQKNKIFNLFFNLLIVILSFVSFIKMANESLSESMYM